MRSDRLEGGLEVGQQVLDVLDSDGDAEQAVGDAGPLALARTQEARGPEGSCQPTWQATFGARPGVSGSVDAFATHDDGSGPALFAAGDFATAAGVARIVGRWDGTSWSALGGGIAAGGSIQAHALGVFDDGTGLALYVGGYFSSAGGVTGSRVR